MDILIKSFNRVFYLDRCIKSILQNVRGQYNIKILDDGTPEKYLAKIQRTYPSVEILRSANYTAKSKKILSQEEINGFEIPTSMWREAVRNAEDYFLITEDDVWFTDEINLDEIRQQMAQSQIHLVKLGWLGISSDDRYARMEKISELLETTIPVKIFTSNQFIMNLFIFNKFKLFSILYKLGFVDNYTSRKYWLLNSILMGVFKKEYWLYIWKDSPDKINEKIQLRNAAVWFNRNKKNKNLIARTKKEYMKTTFSSSASGSYHDYGVGFDVNYFNYLMNEAWLNDELNSMQNYPEDFSKEYFKQFFDDKADKDEYEAWMEKFKQQYRNLGAAVD